MWSKAVCCALAVALLGAGTHTFTPGTVPHNQIDNTPYTPVTLPRSLPDESPRSLPFVQFPNGQSTVTLPARFVHQAIVVSLTIAGHPYDFALDSGASSIVIDRSVAESLGLRMPAKAPAAGSVFENTQVIIPSIDIAGVVMRNVVANSLPLHYKVSDDSHVVGLLGFDFIAGVVLHVDYANQRVEAIAPALFTQPRGEAYVLPLQIDDGVPLTEAVVGEQIGKHFVVDTGASGVVLFSSFVRKHFPEALSEMNASTDGKTPPFISASGVGGTVTLQSAQVERFSFGSVRFSDFTAYVTRSAPGLADTDLDGVIGADALKYFDLYFDYRNQRLIVVPGEFLHENAGKL